MPEFVKFLLWAGALLAAAYYLIEEMRPHAAKKLPTAAEIQKAAEEKAGLDESPRPDPKNLRIIALSQLAGDSRDIPGSAVRFFNRSDHPDLMAKFIIEAISHPDPLIRRNAAEVAGLMRLTAARTALENRVQDPSREVQRAAVNALKFAGDKRSVFAIVLALKSPYWETRLDAAEALGYHGGPSDLRYLWTALGDSEALVADAAAASILKIARRSGAAALPFLEAKLADRGAARAELARRAIEAAKQPAPGPPRQKAGARSRSPAEPRPETENRSPGT